MQKEKQSLNRFLCVCLLNRSKSSNCSTIARCKTFVQCFASNTRREALNIMLRLTQEEFSLQPYISKSEKPKSESSIQ